MHNPLRRPPLCRRAPFALLLSLAVLGGTGCGKEPGVTGHMRVRHGDVWEEFPTPGSGGFLPNADRSSDFDFGPVFAFCNSDDLSLEERREDARGLCVYVDFESFAKGSGPAEYAIEGTTEVPDQRYAGSRYKVQFEPGPGHSPGLKAAWTQSFCPDGDDTVTALQQVSGRFVLEENSEDRLRGQLELTVQGPTAGTCPGDAAEVSLDFDFQD
ncbi:hypothetical protein [Corallococcus carmarthensis]|uniref:hypothetical protein n=1 Tax=Corallococcus carmarthensis TaxID=2316728 RepID=UPI00148DAEDF|nr:hypothetical protein [Corallococcus carmarthensis]NOK17648.1 hypothetical protein [Corallococcus carmarthensis]